MSPLQPSVRSRFDQTIVKDIVEKLLFLQFSGTDNKIVVVMRSVTMNGRRIRTHCER